MHEELTLLSAQILLDPRYRVPAGGCGASGGIGWLRSHVPRFQDGDDHVCLRRQVKGLIEDLRVPGTSGLHPTVALLAAQGLSPDLLADVELGSCDPPVPFTRRVAPDGSTVLVDLTEAPFGAGPHACPGRDLGVRLARARVAGMGVPS